MKTIFSKFWLLAGFAILFAACNKKQIDYIGHSQISGGLSYKTTSDNNPAPIGSLVTVRFNGSTDPTYSFRTTEKGRYKFIPQVKGNYVFEFTVVDTVLQYNALLRQKEDLDETRTSIRIPVAYAKSAEPELFSVNEANTLITRDVLVSGSPTGFRVTVNDDQGNPLRDARVCLYQSKDFADRNSPNCSGSIAYLSTDASGSVTFLGLEAKQYFINAKASIGAANVNNQWSIDMRNTGQLQAGVVSSKVISLK